MQFARKLIMASYMYPALYQPPAHYTTVTLVSISGANNAVYTIPADGWYRVDVLGGGGGAGSEVPYPSSGGYISKLVYLYQGMKCVMWSGAIGGRGAAGASGYPGTQTTDFGGQGAVGQTRTTTSSPSTGTSFTIDIESGAGGGGGACQGRNGNTYHSTGGSGAGSGFIAGYIDKTMPDQSVTLGSMTVNLNRNYTIGSVASFTCITTYLICGGGGGATNDNGSHRSSGGGGGAFGNGGSAYDITIPATSGPAGAWGKGEDGGRYGGGTRGAWAIVDFSTNTFTWGLGGGTAGAHGYCTLYKVIPV